MKSCKNCEELHDNRTAPPRGKACPRSVYDGIPNYAEFKHKNQIAHKIQQRNEKIYTPNDKYTNPKLNSNNVENVENDTTNFTTQEIANFRNSLRKLTEMGVLDGQIPPSEGDNITSSFNHGHCLNSLSKFLANLLHPSNEIPKPEAQVKRNASHIEFKPKISKSSESFINISRSPINCPDHRCNLTIGITSLLSHLLRDHKQCFPIDFNDTEGDKRSVLIFSEDILNYGENKCLGVLAYGGRDSNENNRPGVIGLSRTNSFLPEKYSHFVNHLPILIMGCKILLSDVIAKKTGKTFNIQPHDNTKDIIVLWLATTETTRSIYSTITVFDQDMTSSRSSIIKVRNLKYSQNPSDFLNEESNFLMLNRGDINILSNNEQSAIEIEIFIHEIDN